jgi:hypothetical protein
LMSPLACINKEAPSGLMMMAVKSELVINPYNSFTLLFLDQVRFPRKSKKTDYSVHLDLFPYRNRMDCKCSHHNSCYWVWCSFLGLGYSSAGMDCWASFHVLVFYSHLLYFFSALCLLPLWWSFNWQEELHLHGCCSVQSW